MICPICGTEFEPYRNNQKYCKPECNKVANRNYARNNPKNYRPKNKKHKCMMCGLNRCDGKYQICEQCKQTDVYQSYGYWQPWSIHS